MHQLDVFEYLNEIQRPDSDKKEVRRISYESTIPFLLEIHYARRMPCITDAFGLFLNEMLIGVVTYGIPASHQLCIGVCGKRYKDNVRELNRLCLLPKYNGGNYSSYLVGRSLRMLPSGTIVVSYADTGMGHNGYIYQATNFIYTGCTQRRRDQYNSRGKHPRHGDQQDSDLMQSRNPKHRYIYICGDRRTKRELTKKIRYKAQPYPKNESVRYDVNDPKLVIPIEVTER